MTDSGEKPGRLNSHTNVFATAITQLFKSLANQTKHYNMD